MHAVSISGGKDSGATACLALETCERDSIRLVAADTGNEHECWLPYIDYLGQRLGLPIAIVRADFTENIAHQRTIVETKWRAEGIPEDRLQIVLAGLVPSGNPFLDLCIWKGRFPSRKAQFCTEFLKTIPLTEYQLQLVDQGYDVWSWQGVRMDESASRRTRLQGSGACVLGGFEVVGGGLFINRPIARWTARDAFAALAAYGIKPNPLYTQGMSRVGCMPCINSSKGEILAISKRFPRHIERIAMWEETVKITSKRGDASFFPNPDREAHLNKRGVLNMVEWSRTERGGRVYSILADEEPAACSSSYGLCE